MHGWFVRDLPASWFGAGRQSALPRQRVSWQSSCAPKSAIYLATFLSHCGGHNWIDSNLSNLTLSAYDKTDMFIPVKCFLSQKYYVLLCLAASSSLSSTTNDIFWVTCQEGYIIDLHVLKVVFKGWQIENEQTTFNIGIYLNSENLTGS